MSTQELYIRNATETEARGPFNVEQIADLADAGHVSPETLIYDATTEQWVALNSNPELMTAIFPEKRKLTLKPKTIQTLNQVDEAVKPITVNDMLDAAEGLTDDTRSKANPETAMMRAARLGLIAAIVTLVLSAAAGILPHSQALVAMDLAKLAANPLAILGVVDLVLAVLLALGMTALYPVIRFRAALGFGLLGFMFYAQGLPVLFAAALAGSAGLYLCTLVVSLAPAVLAAAAGVGGMGLLAWHLLTS
jgi:hypothetical protein